MQQYDGEMTKVNVTIVQQNGDKGTIHVKGFVSQLVAR
jgi:hypothetical protein